jgi:hypothetical protein
LVTRDRPGVNRASLPRSSPRFTIYIWGPPRPIIAPRDLTSSSFYVVLPVNIVMSRGGLRRRVLNRFLFMSSIGPQTRIPGISYTEQKHLRYAKIHGIMFDPAPLKSLFLGCASSSSSSGISWGPLSYLCGLFAAPLPESSLKRLARWSGSWVPL